MDLQVVFVKIGDSNKFRGFLVEFLENRWSWENQKPPEKRQKSGLFWASPFTMHLVKADKNLVKNDQNFHEKEGTLTKHGPENFAQNVGQNNT